MLSEQEADKILYDMWMDPVLTRLDVHVELPPGFWFHLTDEEVNTHYLSNKVVNSNFDAGAMGEMDLNKCELHASLP